MKILNFKPYEKNTLKGFIEVEMPSGMIIKNLTYHRKSDGEKTSEWLGLPSKEYTKQDGSKGWADQIDFVTRNLYWDFVTAVLKAFKEHLSHQKPERVSLDAEQEQGAGDTPF